RPGAQSAPRSRRQTCSSGSGIQAAMRKHSLEQYFPASPFEIPSCLFGRSYSLPLAPLTIRQLATAVRSFTDSVVVPLGEGANPLWCDQTIKERLPLFTSLLPTCPPRLN